MLLSFYLFAFIFQYSPFADPIRSYTPVSLSLLVLLAIARLDIPNLSAISI